jgi:hypothetical protein
MSKGQLPADTGMDDKTKPEVVDNFKELGGKALKVAFAPGDSFGARGGSEHNWKRFAFFRFNAFNPSPNTAALEVTVVHARSASYQTRVVVPIKLKPGNNEVKLGIDAMANVNGSVPDLACVERWYILDVDRKGPTAYFSDIWLEGGEPPALAPVSRSSAGPQPLVGYRLKGKVGSMEIDLTLTPFIVSGSMASAAVHGDPARLARLRQAKIPAIEKPVLFDTSEADAIIAALEVFPPDNPWNLVVADWPVHPNSEKIVSSIGPAKPFRCNTDMGFILVPADQKKIDVRINSYANESDKGPFPVPDNTPIEGWPVEYSRRKTAEQVTLDDVQRDALNERGDRHGLVVDPTRRLLYEFYQLKKTDAGWQAAQASVFDLKTNQLRPDE